MPNENRHYSPRPPGFISVEALNASASGTRPVPPVEDGRTTILPDEAVVRAHPETGTPIPPVFTTEPQSADIIQPNSPDLVESPDEGSAEVLANPRRPRINPFASEPEVGVVVETNERDTFENLILFPEVQRDVTDAMRLISQREQLESVWHLSSIYPMDGRVVISLYGPSGTGKTRVARAAARSIGKNLYQVDYAAIISKYLGDTAKHIKQAFARARQLDAVLFFDEADSLMSRRVDMGESCATSINQNRNTLMQELDRFKNPVFMTTNLFGNYDPAFIRRIAKHIRFAIPNAQMRKQIFLKHIPDIDRVDADLDLVAAAADTLAGGDIYNVCLNTVLASSVNPDSTTWRLKQETFLAEIQKVKDARNQNENSTVRRPRRVEPVNPPAAESGTSPTATQ